MCTYRAALQTAIDTLHDTDLKGRAIFVREDREAGAGGGSAGGGGGMFSRGGGGGGTGCQVYVGNLSWDCKWQDLKDHFKQAEPQPLPLFPLFPLPSPSSAHPSRTADPGSLNRRAT